MMNLEKEFEKIKEKLDSMNMTDFDEMLEKCGVMTIQNSMESDFVQCMRSTFTQTASSYRTEQKYSIKMREEFFDYDLADGQGAA